MITPTQLKKILDSSPKQWTTEQFFKLHISIEGYVKRVMLIGLRLNEVQYENSRRIVESTYINTASLIEKVLWLVDRSDNKQGVVIGNLKEKYQNFFVLKDLVINFSAIYRNRLAHGTISELSDQTTIDYLCQVNQSFYRSFEKLLMSEHGHSAHETPRSWGAIPGKKEDISNSVKRLKLGQIVREPYSLSKVHELLQKTVE